MLFPDWRPADAAPGLRKPGLRTQSGKARVAALVSAGRLTVPQADSVDGERSRNREELREHETGYVADAYPCE